MALALMAICSVVVVRAQSATAATGPDSHTQPLLDGCQRSQSLNLAVSTPEWVYVNSNDVRTARLAGNQTVGRKTVEGVVTESRPAGEDLYVNHDFHDFNVFIHPDPKYDWSLGSGNRIPGREYGIEGEWEVSKIPLWAWPSRGDRVRVSGNWIWDCGHWGNSSADPTELSQLLVYDPVETAQDLAQPGAIRGETTELHPMYEIARFRTTMAGRLFQYGPRLASQLDVWINGEGSPAHATEECALKGINNAAVARVACTQARDVGGTYSYTLKLRPKPTSTSRLIVNPPLIAPETLSSLRGIPVTIVPDARRGIVKVSFTLPHGPASQKFGVSVRAGWSDDVRAVRHRVFLDKIRIAKSLDGSSEPNLNPGGVPGEQASEPGEWVLYASVAGLWRQIPAITQVSDGQQIKLGISMEFFLPPGVTPRLYVSGHECDEPLIDCIHEGPGRKASTIGSLELGFNDRPGRIQDDRRGVVMRPGTFVYRPPVNPDPSSGNEDLSDAICGSSGCYQITATWRAG